MSTEISFEEKIEKAKALLNKLNSSDITLNEGMEVYKQGIKELKEAQKLLEDAKEQYKNLNSEES